MATFHALFPVAGLFLLAQTSDTWTPLVRSEDRTVASSRLRFNETDPEKGEAWVLNLRNDTTRTVDLNVRWSLRGQSFTEAVTLGPERIHESSRAFPVGDGKTSPEVSLLSWEYRKEE